MITKLVTIRYLSGKGFKLEERVKFFPLSEKKSIFPDCVVEGEFDDYLNR